MHKIPVGVLGASGYAGRELCELVVRHPKLDLAFAAANSRRGESVRIAGRDVRFVAAEDAPITGTELVFSSLPHGASAEWVARVEAAGVRAVDLSADLRPGNTTRAVPYGLTEVAREDVRGANVVSNPGCYPTATLLALLPLLEKGLVKPGATINVVAASGVTGAGFTPRPDLLFA
jgi:N-acetyl-gamma-glutamyl-phosphate reductase